MWKRASTAALRFTNYVPAGAASALKSKWTSRNSKRTWRTRTTRRKRGRGSIPRIDPRPLFLSPRIDPRPLFLPREVPRFFERLPGFEQALQAGQNQRPAVRRHADQFRIGLVDLLDERELDRFLLLFKLVGDTCVAFEMGFRKDFARAARQDQAPGRIDFEDF